MVGRLVEQQDVGLGRQRAGNRGAAGLATRQVVRMLLAGEAEFAEQIGGAVMLVTLAHPGLDVFEHGVEPRHVGLLRQIAHGGARLHEAVALVGFDEPGGDLQQGRLAGAVAADEADALAGSDRELG